MLKQGTFYLVPLITQFREVPFMLQIVDFDPELKKAIVVGGYLKVRCSVFGI
jgi:hypothetical protein